MIRKLEVEYGDEQDQQNGAKFSKVHLARLKMIDPGELIVKGKIEKINEAIEDLELKKREVDLIGKDQFLNTERRISFLENRAKRLTLEIMNKMIEKDLSLDDNEKINLPRKAYELEYHALALQEENHKLNENINFLKEKNIELKIELDRRIQSKLNKQNQILQKQEKLKSKTLMFNQIYHEMGADLKDISEEEDLFDEPYLASRKRVRKMKLRIEYLLNVTLREEKYQSALLATECEDNERNLVDYHIQVQEITQEIKVADQ